MCVRQGNRSSVVRYTVIALLVTTALPSFAAVNSWLKPTSGNWEEPYWSQGILPNSGHAVMITNAGWKAVQIAPSTVQNSPDSLNVYSLTVLSPVDSYNTVLMNHAGFARPLTVNYSMHVGPGAALTMHASALNIATPVGVGLSVGGEVHQNDSSQVYGNQVDVGYVGPGVYNLNSGLMRLQHLWVKGSSNNAGVFHQNGGSNSPGILHLEAGGRYNLRDGDFNGITYTAENSIFQQDGGCVHRHLEFHKGQYVLNGGINYGGISVPVYGNYERGSASAIQNGGTNLGPISVGSDQARSGSYILSNGVVQASTLVLDMFGSFQQYGGVVSTPSTITLSWGYYNRGDAAGSHYGLAAGNLSSAGINIDRSGFSQGGGTNQVAGDISIVQTYYGSGQYSLDGGLLTSLNTGIGHGDYGGFFQAGGTHRIANTLSISPSYSSFSYYDWRYEMTGGNLFVSNIVMAPRAVFRQSGGTVNQSGTLTMDSSRLTAGPGTQQFGALQLTGSNHLTMPSASAVSRFRSSSAQPWAADSSLIIDNYSGSYLGGGSQRIIFGNTASALTPQQVAKIFFRNPANLPYGTHPAKILSTGEVVPDSFPPVGRIPPRLTLRKLPDSTVEITLTTEPGYDYGVLTSTDLTTWNFWTNRVATTNTLTFVDPHNIQWWPFRRFYKAVFMR